MNSENRYCLITGISEGIGREIAIKLLEQKFFVLSTVSPGKSEKTVKERFPINYREKILLFPCDLSSQREVKTFCKKIVSESFNIEVLIHNAAVVYGNYTLSIDEVEMQWAVNYMAAYLISILLFESMDKNGRIIFTSTRAHYRSNNDWLNAMNPEVYSPSSAYARSKLALMTFFVSLSNKVENTDKKILAYHPGLVRTRIGNKHMSSMQQLLWNLMKLLGKSPKKAAIHAIYLAIPSTTIEITNGSYYAGSKISKAKETCYDADSIHSLLRFSESLTGTSIERL